MTPLDATLVFNRLENEAWSSSNIRVENSPRYATASQTITFNPSMMNLQPMSINLEQFEVMREFAIKFSTNLDGDKGGCDVYVDNQLLTGKTPLTEKVVYRRSPGTTAWPTVAIRVEKKDYQYRPPDQQPVQSFTKSLSVEEAAGGSVVAPSFQRIEYLETPTRYFKPTEDGAEIEEATEFSSISDLRDLGSTPRDRKTLRTDQPFVLSRFATAPNSDNLVLVVPNTRQTPTLDGEKTEYIGTGLYLQKGALAPSRITSVRDTVFNLDPFVTDDGEWVYYASDHLGSWGIWRASLKDSSKAPQKVFSESGWIYTQPCWNSKTKKLLMTGKKIDARDSNKSYVIRMDPDRLTTPLAEGHSASWSPDGTEICYVSLGGKITIINDEGQGEQPLTQSAPDVVERNPVWMPDGKSIIYASNEAVNKDLNRRNFDIYIIEKNKTTPTPITDNRSFEDYPSVAHDAKGLLNLYFYSNRGAQKTGDESFSIYQTNMENIGVR